MQCGNAVSNDGKKGDDSGMSRSSSIISLGKRSKDDDINLQAVSLCSPNCRIATNPTFLVFRILDLEEVPSLKRM